MNVFKLFTIACGIACIIGGCSNQLQYPNYDDTPKLVVWGILYPDSLPRIQVYTSFSPLNPPDEINQTTVSGALVILFEDGAPADTLQEILPGTYTSTDFLPTVGKAYHVMVEKSGFEQLVSDPDTMPNTVAIDSFYASFSTNTNQLNKLDALIYLKTRVPVDLNIVGTSIYREDNSVLPVSASNIPTNLCDILPPLQVYGYTIRDYTCSDPFSIIVINNSIIDSNDRHTKFKISAGFFSPKSERIFKQISIFNNYNIDALATNVFYEPVFIPIEAQGGYGFVSCCNAIDTLIKF